MSDKEKQIEELAKDIENAKRDIWASVITRENDEDYLWHSRRIAEHLIKQCYQKADKDSVIISKSEYDKLTLLANECIDWRGKYCNTNIPQKIDKNSVVLTREDLENMANAKMKCINDMAIITRKETAREILKWLTHEDNVYELNPTVTFYYTKKEFEELAKQYGVEIQE